MKWVNVILLAILLGCGWYVYGETVQLQQMQDQLAERQEVYEQTEPLMAEAQEHVAENEKEYEQMQQDKAEALEVYGIWAERAEEIEALLGR